MGFYICLCFGHGRNRTRELRSNFVWLGSFFILEKLQWLNCYYPLNYFFFWRRMQINFYPFRSLYHISLSFSARWKVVCSNFNDKQTNTSIMYPLFVILFVELGTNVLNSSWRIWFEDVHSFPRTSVSHSHRIFFFKWEWYHEHKLVPFFFIN